MNKIDLSITGGFPLTTDTLSNMQEAYRMGIDALTKLGGDNYILSGCVENNIVVSDGVLVLHGEAIPFKGGVKQNTIYVKETVTQAQFEDGKLKDIYYAREARFGSGEYSWSSFLRISNLLELKTALDAQTKAFNDYIADYEPSWGSITNKPTSYPPATHKTEWKDITGVPTVMGIEVLFGGVVEGDGVISANIGSILFSTIVKKTGEIVIQHNMNSTDYWVKLNVLIGSVPQPFVITKNSNSFVVNTPSWARFSFVIERYTSIDISNL